ncbi:hypothetical protein M378DRAFT_65049 [Amanita muscaria Koide BX008]|uniref:Uncharacterized protein n=1 Tax=Amanita muscaria (strain Koide BX008) TaxID=946122 RepID=A0A0C2XQ50_AMAMK|nr:hypothetical protein M378DRAFT_65049 [Amanita muscaria Koide BX008]
MSVPLQKRSRSTNLPLLPKITGEIILQVFTHRSLQRSHGGTLEDNSDNDRFSILGKVVLDAVVTLSLFSRRPALTAAEIGRWKECILSDDNFEDWVSGYKLRNKVRCHPQVFSLLSIPGETRNLFYSYVGGVYAESGMDVVEKWVGQLIDRCSENSTFLSMTESMHRMEPPPPAKKLKSEPLTPSKQTFPLFFLSPPAPSPPTDLPPPPPKAAINLPNPLAPAQPNLPFLPLFNQAASQRRCIVEYPAEFSGPSHAGKWTVRCVVNGILKGVGTGTSKQVAKEEAARKAYYAMGWT